LICEKFIHNDPDAFHGKELTLHDCISDKISFENGILRFNMPDGFWVTTHHNDNECGKIVRTGVSKVDFTVKDLDDITVRVFRPKRWCWSRKTSVEVWHIEHLISEVNSGRCTIEFVTQYRTYFEQMWHCIIHSKKKLYYRECQLHLPETDAIFRWNNLRPECEW